MELAVEFLKCKWIDSNALLEWTIARGLCACACPSGCAVMQECRSKTSSGGASSVRSILSLKGTRFGSKGDSGG